MTIRKVGFIGVGDQGEPMAEAIAEAGFELHLWARRPEVLAAFKANGAIIHDTPAGLAAAVDTLGLCVTGEADVRQVLFDGGALDALKPGAIVTIHSTISPEACRELAGEADRRGVILLDAPVSGARAGAQARKLLLMVGGDAGAFERVLPVLRSYGDPVRHLGPVGSGQVTKILNNLVLNATMAAGLFGLELGEELGLDRGALRELLLHGTARSYSLEVIDVVMTPGRGVGMAPKDLQLAQDLAEGLPVRPAVDAMARLGLKGREWLAGGPLPTSDDFQP